MVTYIFLVILHCSGSFLINWCEETPFIYLRVFKIKVIEVPIMTLLESDGPPVGFALNIDGIVDTGIHCHPVLVNNACQ